MNAGTKQVLLDTGRGYDVPMEATRVGVRAGANVGAGLSVGIGVGSLAETVCAAFTDGACLIPAAIAGGLSGAAASSAADEGVTTLYDWIDTTSGAWPWDHR